MTGELKKFVKILRAVESRPRRLYVSMGRGEKRGNAKLVGNRLIILN